MPDNIGPNDICHVVTKQNDMLGSLPIPIVTKQKVTWCLDLRKTLL